MAAAHALARRPRAPGAGSAGSPAGPAAPATRQQQRRRHRTLVVLAWAVAVVSALVAFGTAQVSYDIRSASPRSSAQRSACRSGWSSDGRSSAGRSPPAARGCSPTRCRRRTSSRWPWQVMHGLVMLALLAAVCAREMLGRAIGAWLDHRAVRRHRAAATRRRAGRWASPPSPSSACSPAGWRARTARWSPQAEVSEAERERRVVLEERTRIARDLHDIVAHHMSLVVVQAETAPYRVADLSEAARAELDSISTSARSALAETRALLAVLRQEGDAAEHAPQPGIGDLGPLLDGARRAGVPLTADVRVPPEDLRPGDVARGLPHRAGRAREHVAARGGRRRARGGGARGGHAAGDGRERAGAAARRRTSRRCPRRARATGSPGCASGPGPRAGRSGSAGPRRAGSRWRRCCRCRSRSVRSFPAGPRGGWRERRDRSRDDSGHGRGRPGHGAGGLLGAAGGAARLPGRGLRVRRGRGGARGAAPGAGRRPHGRPHAEPRRHRGHAPDHGVADGPAAEGADADDVRPRRLRLRGAAGRRERVPAQGRAGRRTWCGRCRSWPPATACWRRP